MGKESFLQVGHKTMDTSSVIELSGSLIGSEVFKFRHACSEAVKSGMPHRIVDLTDVHEIDGYGMAGLVGLLARRSREGGQVVLCGVNPDLRSRFEATHCDCIFQTAVSQARALEKLRGEES